jgi:purine-binding chemotaxis protein CheW
MNPMKNDARLHHDEVQLAVLKVAGEKYALDIMRIKEIQRYQQVTRIPKAPEFIEGVINLRGTVIPIVDMRKRLDLTVAEPTKKTRIVIANVAGKIVGILVDEVNEVVRVNRGDIGMAPAIARGIGSEYITGVVKRKDELLLLLDFDKILTTEERVRIAEIKAKAAAAAQEAPTTA